MKKTLKTIMYGCILAVGLLLFGNNCSAANCNYTEVPAETQEPGKGNVFLGIPGEFDTHVQEAINLINKYRKEACNKGYADPRNFKRKLSPSDYVPIQWSRDLEWIARIRAAENHIHFEHSRPNDKKWCEITTENGIHSYAECLANESGDTMSDGIKRYYKEKDIYLGKENGSCAHYEALINPDNIYIGSAQLYNEMTTLSVNVCEFLSKSSIKSMESALGKSIVIDSTPLPNMGRVICKVEAQSKFVSKPDIYSFDYTQLSIKDYWTTKLLVRCSYKRPALNGKEYFGMGCYMGDVKWTCSSKYLTITDDGIVIPKKYTKERNIKFKYKGDLKGECYEYLAVVPEPGEIVKYKTSKGKFYVKFKKRSTADGYIVKLSRGFDAGSCIKKVTLSKKKNSYTFKNLPSGLYMVEIQPYKRVKGKKIVNTSTRKNNIILGVK